MVDPYDLNRFVDAQDRGGVFTLGRAELRDGRKTTHWMWFVFPQIAGLGRSATSRAFAISSLAEARAYLDHPVLGPRLLECAGILDGGPHDDAAQMFGTVDAQKLRSSMTLFMRAAPDNHCSCGCSTGTSVGAPIRQPSGALSPVDDRFLCGDLQRADRAGRPHCRGTARAAGRLSPHPGHSPRPARPSLLNGVVAAAHEQIAGLGRQPGRLFVGEGRDADLTPEVLARAEVELARHRPLSTDVKSQPPSSISRYWGTQIEDSSTIPNINSGSGRARRSRSGRSWRWRPGPRGISIRWAGQRTGRDRGRRRRR